MTSDSKAKTPAPAGSRRGPRGRARGSPREADDVGGAGRPAADRAAVRHRVDAARRRPARGGLGEQVRRQDDDAGRHGGGGDDQHQARRADRLQRRQDQGVDRARASSATRKAPPRRRRPPAPPRPTRPPPPDDTTSQDTTDMDMFNNDVRLRALKTLAETLSADRAEEGDPLLQRRHAAERRRQPGRAARGDQRRGPRQRLDLSGRHPRPAGGRPRRRRDARRAGAARRSSPAAAWRSSFRSSRRRRTRWRRSPPTPADARSPTPTTSRGLRARAARHVGLLPARLQHVEHQQGRALPHASASA